MQIKITNIDNSKAASLAVVVFANDLDQVLFQRFNCRPRWSIYYFEDSRRVFVVSEKHKS